MNQIRISVKDFYNQRCDLREQIGGLSLGSNQFYLYFLYWWKTTLEDSETWIAVLFRPPDSIIPWNLFTFAFMELSAWPLGHNLGFILQLCADHIYIFVRDTDTIIIGVIIQISFGYEIKYIIKKYVKNQGAKYRSLRNAFKQFSPFTWVSQVYPLFAVT